MKEEIINYNLKPFLEECPHCEAKNNIDTISDIRLKTVYINNPYGKEKVAYIVCKDCQKEIELNVEDDAMNYLKKIYKIKERENLKPFPWKWLSFTVIMFVLYFVAFIIIYR